MVFTAVATVRTSTVLAENNAIGWPQEGKILDVTGESDNWYRINYPVNGENQTCYIAKTVAADASVLDAFTACEEQEVEISEAAVNVRSYPSTASNNSIRGSLKKGTKVIRIATSENWSRIKYEVVSETETDANGNAKVEIKEYYVSNDCIKVPEAATEAPTEAPAQ
jgi:SH3-like domain-containing protein